MASGKTSNSKGVPCRVWIPHPSPPHPTPLYPTHPRSNGIWVPPLAPCRKGPPPVGVGGLGWGCRFGGCLGLWGVVAWAAVAWGWLEVRPPPPALLMWGELALPGASAAWRWLRLPGGGWHRLVCLPGQGWLWLAGAAWACLGLPGPGWG